MNRGMRFKIFLIIAPLMYVVLQLLSAEICSLAGAEEKAAPENAFSTPDDYLRHIGKADSCTSRDCHAKLAPGSTAFSHKPVAEGKCGDCHNAEAYPDRYGLEKNQNVMCTGCHQPMADKIQSSQFVHGPIKNGDCISCHDPHGSDTRYILTKPYNELCSGCHNLKGLYAGEFVHKPVKDGNCGLCHDPHASDFKSRLADVGANLCFTCHETFITGMAQKYIHAPLIKSGCSDCHDPHSGKDILRLKSPPDELCFRCHEENKNEVSQYTLKHEPASAGRCVSCHSPHFSESKYLLNGKVDVLCYSCHKESRKWKERKFQHGPVVQGNCVACHNPHGSDNSFILRLAFPNKFYSPYEKGEYNLCFLCHKEAMVTTEITENVTHFRNGKINLHMLHVNQEKGRTCRACHDVHASNQEDHIREQFKFGVADIPIYYFKTDTGGGCIPGCHVERKYDRIKEVKNIRTKKITIRKNKPAKK